MGGGTPTRQRRPGRAGGLQAGLGGGAQQALRFSTPVSPSRDQRDPGSGWPLYPARGRSCDPFCPMEKPQLSAHGQQLLVVDDQAFFAGFLQEKFQELGYSVSTARDAFAALALVSRSKAPLVVLLDLMLPQVSGHQLLRELAKGPHAATIRVVLVSAHHT